MKTATTPLWLLFLLSCSALVGLAAGPVQRSLVIEAPSGVAAGASVHVDVSASTTAADGEQIGFFQAEYSVDGGRNWLPVYHENVGRASRRGIDFTAGPAGTTILVRARMAFRGGAAGDVDFAGQPIKWDESWTRWSTPPARHAAIRVGAAR